MKNIIKLILTVIIAVLLGFIIANRSTIGLVGQDVKINYEENSIKVDKSEKVEADASIKDNQIFISISGMKEIGDYTKISYNVINDGSRNIELSSKIKNKIPDGFEVKVEPETKEVKSGNKETISITVTYKKISTEDVDKINFNIETTGINK